MIEQSQARKTWKERIEQAKKRGKFEDGDKEMAKTFDTCAVSEWFSFRSWYHSKDAKFVNEVDLLGVNFLAAVESDNIPEAERIYNEIQKLPTKRAEGQ